MDRHLEARDVEAGSLRFGLYACDVTLSDCDLLAKDGDGFTTPTPTYAEAVFDFGSITHTFTAAKPMLRIKLVATENADDDMWLAYDTAAYPAHIELFVVG